ncbi:hypothetical protein E4U50_007387 [Claviceps purpurea]|nr:hypothetical protein E4U50_007387 [Claviceps purpurea]
MAKAAKLGQRWHKLRQAHAELRGRRASAMSTYLAIKETPKTCRERGAAIGSQALHSRQVMPVLYLASGTECGERDEKLRGSRLLQPLMTLISGLWIVVSVATIWSDLSKLRSSQAWTGLLQRESCAGPSRSCLTYEEHENTMQDKREKQTSQLR